MAAITMWLDDTDAAIVRSYARLAGKSVPDFVRDAVLEKIEDQRYLATLHATLAEDDGARRIQNQILAELRL